jgi:putative ABC transport system substrate-binding protein
MPRIGVLTSISLSKSNIADRIQAFREGLSDLGYVEGTNIVVEYRHADGDFDRLPELAGEFVRLKVDVIVTGPGSAAARAAKGATTTIPIVMVALVDPVGQGLVASLARPGGNVTGFTFDVTQEQAGKNLELLKEAAPEVSRVAILRHTNSSPHVAYSKEAERAAKILGVTIQFAEVPERSEKSLEDALGAVVTERANALLVAPSPFFTDRRQQIIDFAARNKLPTIYGNRAAVDAGGLMSYDPNSQYVWRRSAVYVDKILKGANPAELPVEQPTKFELIINLKAATQIGLAIPPSVLARADKVIK